MNIAIITLPLHVNYGGILQAYALQRYLVSQGHTVTTLDIPSKIKPKDSLLRQFRAFAGTSLNVVLGKDKFENIYWPLNRNHRNLQAVRMSMRPFISKIMNISQPLRTSQELAEYCQTNNIEAVIVGSDQVWRPRYNSNIEFSYLSFLPEYGNIKRIAVSASFGTSDWEYTAEQTERFAHLAKRFTSISVRENSGVPLCNQYLGVDAIQTIDPTMLLSTKEYDYIIELDSHNTVSVDNKIFSYIIDNSKSKNTVVNDVCRHFVRNIFELNPNERPRPYSSVKAALKAAPKPLAQWLRAIKESAFVTTDSFHGTVFCILYHKPFIVISNRSRGQARLETLLKIFGLENRLVDTESDTDNAQLLQICEEHIDWSRIDALLESRRLHLQNYIRHSLTL